MKSKYLKILDYWGPGMLDSIINIPVWLYGELEPPNNAATIWKVHIFVWVFDILTQPLKFWI